MRIFLTVSLIVSLTLGCQEPSTYEQINLDDPDVRNKILDEAISGEKLILKGIKPQNSYAPNSEYPYTGWAFHEYPNGKIRRISQYERGQERGLTVRWYSNGQKNFERFFSDGKFITYKVWKPNGEICPITKIDQKGTGVVARYQEFFGKEISHTVTKYKRGKRIEN